MPESTLFIVAAPVRRAEALLLIEQQGPADDAATCSVYVVDRR